jgi:hypothetical protein
VTHANQDPTRAIRLASSRLGTYADSPSRCTAQRVALHSHSRPVQIHTYCTYKSLVESLLLKLERFPLRALPIRKELGCATSRLRTRHGSRQRHPRVGYGDCERDRCVCVRVCVYGVSIANGRGGQLVFLEVKMRLRGVFNCSELMANSVDNMRRSCGATVPGQEEL